MYIGYDQIPIDSMEGLDLDSPMDLGPEDLDFGTLPDPPQDNSQVAAWYDTDL